MFALAAGKARLATRSAAMFSVFTTTSATISTRCRPAPTG
jgi:hypothetical protein